LTDKQRTSMDKDVFAYVDRNGEGHLPLNDESHVRNAMARFNQTSFPSASAKESARRKVVAAAKRHRIEVSDDDNIAKPTGSVRAAHTRLGPSGCRKAAKPKRTKS